MLMRKYKQIIWDWNGTLLDDVDICVEVMNGLLKKYDLPAITTEYYKAIFNFPVRDYYIRLGFDFNKYSFEIIGYEYIEEYQKIAHKAQLRNGIKNIVQELEQNQFRQTVISAREHEALVDELKTHDIFPFIDEAIGLNNHYASGKAENVCTFVERNQVSQKETLMIGDTLHDLEVAQAAGIDCLLLADGHHSSKRLLDAGGKVIENINQLREILGLTISR